MRVGIDLGGTKIETAALDDAGEIIYRHRVKTPASCYDRLIKTLAEQIYFCERETREKVIQAGVCIPGVPEGDSGRIKNANLQILNGKTLQNDLQRCSKKKICLINDANSLAWSEYIDGAAAGAASCFGVIIGTGTGGGIVINNHVITGVNSIAGEWGHNPLPGYDEMKDGPEIPCYCGRSRCIETFLSGTAFSYRFNKQFKSGANLTSRLIIEMAREGDIPANEHLKRYCDQLARALGSVINLLDPELVVLGGGMSNIDELYEIVPVLWNKYIFTTHGDIRTKLVKALYGDSSGVRGAAWL